MFQKISKNLFVAIFLCEFIILTSQESACDSFGVENVQEEISGANSKVDCLCTNPCTSDKVKDFVRFYYIKNNSSYHQLNVTNLKASELFDFKGTVKILFHGYTAKGTNGWLPPAGRKLAQMSNGYAILVDYGQTSNCSYVDMMFQVVPAIAQHTSNLIKDLKFDLRNIELIGHSLGSHLCGKVGSLLNGAVQRITGLDPAGPGYDALNIGLNKSCAQFVQILHTEPNNFGTSYLRGHVDFWANNRSSLQPGCTQNNHCSHAKAVYFYYASLFPQNMFIGTTTDCGGQQRENVSKNSCIFGPSINCKNGKFCLNTNSCYPYAKGI